MSNVDAAYGITTYQINVGLSLTANITMMPNVAFTELKAISGGTLFIGGFNVTMTTLVTKGMHIPTTNLFPLHIDGPTGIGMGAAGATAIVHVLQGLRDGYAGVGY